MLPIYTRYLTPADYGILALTAIFSILFGILMTLQLHGAIARFYVEYKGDDLKKFLGTISIAIFIISLFGTLLLLMIGPIVFGVLNYSVPFYPYIFIAILNTFLGTFAVAPLAILRIQEKPFLILLITILSTAIGVSLTLYFLVWLGRGVLGVLEATFCSSLLLNLLFFIPFTVKNIKFSFSLKNLKEALSFSLPLIPHGLSGYVFIYSDRLILERFVPLGPIGLYNLGDNISKVMWMGVNSFNNASVPYFMKLSKNNPNSKEIYSEIITVWAVLVAFAALGISLFSKEIIEIMTTPAFYDAYKVVPILVLAYVFRGLYCFPINGLFYAKKTKIIPIVTISAALTNVALNFLWIPKYGIIGAAWATAAAFGVTVVLAYYFSYKYYPLIYEYGKLLKVFGSGLVIFLITWYIAPTPMLYSILIKLFALLIFLISIFIFRIITIEQVKEGYTELKGALYGGTRND